MVRRFCSHGTQSAHPRFQGNRPVDQGPPTGAIQGPGRSGRAPSEYVEPPQLCRLEGNHASLDRLQRGCTWPGILPSRQRRERPRSTLGQTQFPHAVPRTPPAPSERRPGRALGSVVWVEYGYGRVPASSREADITFDPTRTVISVLPREPRCHAQAMGVSTNPLSPVELRRREREIFTWGAVLEGMVQPRRERPASMAPRAGRSTSRKVR